MVSRLLLKIVKDISHVDVPILTEFLLSFFQYPELGFLDYLFGRKVRGLLVPIILRCDVFILLNPPVSWKVFEPQLLSLENKLRSALRNL